MRGNGSPYPLFDELSASVLSPAFSVEPGKIAIFQAFGFETASRQTDPDKPKVQPQACLRQILYRAPDLTPDYVLDEAIGIFTSGELRGEVLADELIMAEGCPFTLSACNNLALLDLPGSYRLELNDPGSLGQVRVYLRALSADQFTRPSRLYFGG